MHHDVAVKPGFIKEPLLFFALRMIGLLCCMTLLMVVMPVAVADSTREDCIIVKRKKDGSLEFTKRKKHDETPCYQPKRNNPTNYYTAPSFIRDEKTAADVQGTPSKNKKQKKQKKGKRSLTRKALSVALFECPLRKVSRCESVKHLQKRVSDLQRRNSTQKLRNCKRELRAAYSRLCL